MDKKVIRLSPKSEKLMLESLVPYERDDVNKTLSAFYFLYGIAKNVDGIADGETFYDKLSDYSARSRFGGTKWYMHYMTRLDKDSDTYKLGLRFFDAVIFTEIHSIFFNNKNRKQLVKIFNEELF